MKLVIKNSYKITRHYEDGTTTHPGTYLGVDSGTGAHVFIGRDKEDAYYYILVGEEMLADKTAEIEAA
jgi:hypothetical protein